MNYSVLKRELLVALRGSHTQTELSKKLGFTYNQVGKWESEAKQLKWEDFYLLCSFLGIPLETPMREVFLSMESDLGTSKTALQGLRKFHSHLSNTELALKLGCHVSILKRWLTGEVRLNLEVIFAMMDLRPHLLGTFVARLADTKQVPSICDRIQRESTFRSSEASDPLLTVVELCLGLEDYKRLPCHSDSFIAEKLGLTSSTVASLLKSLLIQNRVQWIDGKYSKNFAFINTHGDPLTIAKIHKFWASQALKRFDTPTGVPRNEKQRPNFQSSFVVSISSAGMKKIAERLHLCFEEIYQIIDKDKSPDQEIRIILMDSFSPDDVPSDESSARNGLQ